MKAINYFLAFMASISLFGCNAEIKKFQPELNEKTSMEFQPYFNEDIKPLKKEWKELYYYLKQGHILKHQEQLDYICSYDLYRFLQKHLLKIYETPFLQNYKNFTMVFGKPSITQNVGNKLIVTYSRTVIGDSCQTCNHDLFGFTFDKPSQKLLKE